MYAYPVRQLMIMGALLLADVIDCGRLYKLTVWIIVGVLFVLAQTLALNYLLCVDIRSLSYWRYGGRDQCRLRRVVYN